MPAETACQVAVTNTTRHIDIATTPERVWAAISEATGRQGGP
jgi:hypothetical protein